MELSEATDKTQCTVYSFLFRPTAGGKILSQRTYGMTFRKAVRFRMIDLKPLSLMLKSSMHKGNSTSIDNLARNSGRGPESGIDLCQISPVKSFSKLRYQHNLFLCLQGKPQGYRDACTRSCTRPNVVAGTAREQQHMLSSFQVLHLQNPCFRKIGSE